MDMVTMFLVLSEVEKDTAIGYDKAAAYFIGDTSEQSAATFGRAQKRGEDFGVLNANGASFINVGIIAALKAGQTSAAANTPNTAAYDTIEAYYKLLYAQATLKYAHAIDEAIVHEDAVEMAEMIGEGHTLWRCLRPWLKVWDSANADIIDDIFDVSRTPRGYPYTVHGSNFYTYCHVKKIVDKFVETLPSSVKAHYGSYAEAADVQCLKLGSGGSVSYADASTISDPDDIIIETGVGGITVKDADRAAIADLTYTPASNVGASLYFSEAVKKTLARNTAYFSAASDVLDDYHRFGLEGIADRAKDGVVWAEFAGAAYGFNSATWISDIMDDASELTTRGARLELFEKTLMDALAVQAIMDDLAHAVDEAGICGVDAQGGELPAHGHTADEKRNYWDHAYAKFIGTSTARAFTVYARANELGAHYGTNDANGVSEAARTIITKFKDGAAQAVSASRRSLYSDIKRTIQVIYAQSTLRSAHLVGRDLVDGRDPVIRRAEGLAYYTAISAWVKKSSAAGAGVAGDAIVRDVFSDAVASVSSNADPSFCAVRKVMLALLGSSASRMGTLENTGDVDCAAASQIAYGDGDGDGDASDETPNADSSADSPSNSDDAGSPPALVADDDSGGIHPLPSLMSFAFAAAGASRSRRRVS